jgi:hypothetical protein
VKTVGAIIICHEEMANAGSALRTDISACDIDKIWLS